MDNSVSGSPENVTPPLPARNLPPSPAHSPPPVHLSPPLHGACDVAPPTQKPVPRPRTRTANMTSIDRCESDQLPSNRPESDQLLNNRLSSDQLPNDLPSSSPTYDQLPSNRQTSGISATPPSPRTSPLLPSKHTPPPSDVVRDECLSICDIQCMSSDTQSIDRTVGVCVSEPQDHRCLTIL